MRLGPLGRTLFTTAGWNRALREAGMAAIGWWLSNYAPMRFKRYYAEGMLGYTPSDAKKGRMNRGEPPYFKDGTLQNNLYMRSMPDVKAKNGGITLMVLRFPVGHHIDAKTIKSFKTVPTREANAVGREFRNALVAQMRAGVAAAKAKAEAKAARLARAQANKAKRQEQRERAAERRRLKAERLANRATKPTTRRKAP